MIVIFAFNADATFLGSSEFFLTLEYIKTLQTVFSYAVGVLCDSSFAFHCFGYNCSDFKITNIDG